MANLNNWQRYKESWEIRRLRRGAVNHWTYSVNGNVASFCGKVTLQAERLWTDAGYSVKMCRECTAAHERMVRDYVA